MGKKPRTKMLREQRAKQFAPFQAVDGLYVALRRAEEEHRKMMEAANIISVPLEEDADRINGKSE